MKEIGGYFELELAKGEEYHKDAKRLNTGRNAFEYILRANTYKKVYLPYYTCDVMLEPITKLQIEYEFYSIQNNFEPVFDFTKIKTNEVFLYTNYFGTCDQIVLKLREQCENLIIDNSQAFFSKPLPNVDTFYSARKFFGVSDGAYLYTNNKIFETFSIDLSYNRFEHLLGRIDLGAESLYKNFINNDTSLVNQPIKKMSNLTKSILSSIDYDSIMEKRVENFNYLHTQLQEINQLNLNFDLNTPAMIYPLIINNGHLIKEKLIQNKIFVATYWPNVKEWVDKKSVEMNFVNNLLCLPIDQRYSISDMTNIVKTIHNYYA